MSVIFPFCSGISGLVEEISTFDGSTSGLDCSTTIFSSFFSSVLGVSVGFSCGFEVTFCSLASSAVFCLCCSNI
ncbi:MAG: hypothetical protein LBU14_05065 [Candidatus Peribacteria bacterium]|nr:hypothetical protein [Candidatus Peribacteria bacterium]